MRPQDFSSFTLSRHELRLEARQSVSLPILPTRIRVDGDLQASLSFELLIRNLLRHVSLLIAMYVESRLDLDYRGLIVRAMSFRIHQASLSWHDWQRCSNRQDTKMKLGGFIGEIEYRGDAIAEHLPLLVAGEVLHVGTGTSFGLGKYHKETQ